MTRTAFSLTILSFLAVSLVQVASSQQPASVAGKWDASYKVAGKTVTEQWTIDLTGGKCSATVKRAGGELKITCEPNNAIFRADFNDSDGKLNKIRAAIAGDRMDGSLTIGTTEEHLWSAKRSK